MLIFDSFPNTERAEGFMSAVTLLHNLPSQRFDNQDDADAVDPFPFALKPPIVLVERPTPLDPEDCVDLATEHEVEEMVANFGGRFAGT